MTLVSAVLTLAIAGAGAGDSRPQAEQADHRQPPVFSSEVSLVLLPAFVMDRKGQAVRGLRAQDFEIYEDGKRVEAVSFRYVDTTSEEDQEELRQSSAARRRFLLLFDESFTDPAGLNRAQRAASQFVRKRLAESDLAAVATFDTRNGIRLVANFTDDRVLLAHAVETLGVPTLAQISDPLALASDLGVPAADLTGHASSDVPQALLDSVLVVLARQMRATEVEAYRNDILTLVASLQGLATALRNVEGRKQVVYFSAGFDSRLLIGQQGAEQRAAGDAIAEGRLWEVDGATRYGDSRLVDVLSEMTKSLARADAVVHCVDVTGLAVDRSLTRTYLSEDAGRGGNSGREALHFLSAETGGRFFKDANDLAPVLDEMLQMTSRYYVLGFQPLRSRGPGVFHKVKVKVARKDVNLSHRAGYYEPLPVAQQTAFQRQFEAAQLVMTGAGRNDLAFSSLCLPFPDPGGRQTLGLVVQVPKDSLSWQPGRTTTVEIYGYAVAEDGTVLDHLARSARLDPATADPRGAIRGLSFFGTLRVPPGRYTVRLLVQEPESGASGVRFLEVRVPPYEPQSGFLLPPLLLDEADRWLRLELRPDKRVYGGHPFEVAGEPFVPRASSEVRSGAHQRMVLIAYEPAQPGDPAADVLIRSSLLDREGQAAPLGRLKIDNVYRDPGGRRTYVLGFTAEAIGPGDYTLRVGLGEADSRLQSYALIHLLPGP
jgi:VWFA-related protein